LSKVETDGSPFPSEVIARRITTDQAGMSYGLSGQLKKARALFEKASAEDPGYPLYYYNLACADAEEKISLLPGALEQAFARKGNMIPGEPLPVPTKDGSFLPFKSNKEFWKVLERLEAKRERLNRAARPAHASGETWRYGRITS